MKHTDLEKNFNSKLNNAELLKAINIIKKEKSEITMGKFLLQLINSNIIFPYKVIDGNAYSCIINKEEQILLPIFSQISEVQKYFDFLKKESKEKKSEEEIFLTSKPFFECLKIIEKNKKMSGIILDVFGISFLFDRKLIEFLLADMKTAAIKTAENIETNVKILQITDLTYINDLKIILSNYLKKCTQINKIYAFAGQEKNKIAYYFVIDANFNNKKEMEKMFDNIANKVAPITKINFNLMLYETNNALKNQLTNEYIVYNK